MKADGVALPGKQVNDWSIALPDVATPEGIVAVIGVDHLEEPGELLIEECPVAPGVPCLKVGRRARIVLTRGSMVASSSRVRDAPSRDRAYQPR